MKSPSSPPEDEAAEPTTDRRPKRKRRRWLPKFRLMDLIFNSPAVPGWNEIDAVAIYGHGGSVQWASDAWASSAYGDNQELPGWFWP